MTGRLRAIPRESTARKCARGIPRDDASRGEGITLPAVTRRTDDSIDGTVKFCLPVEATAAAAPNAPRLETESVIIPMTSVGGTKWYTLCLSSQVGCRMACSTFCETGRMGLLQNLTPAQIVRRLRRTEYSPWKPHGESRPRKTSARRSISPTASRTSSSWGWASRSTISTMSYRRSASSPNPPGLDFPHGQITVSTVGRIDGLRKLAEICKAEPVWRNLRIAISLNAANDALRNELMPVNKAMPLGRTTLHAHGVPARPEGPLPHRIRADQGRERFSRGCRRRHRLLPRPSVHRQSDSVQPAGPLRRLRNARRADDPRLPQPPQGARPLHYARRVTAWPRTGCADACGQLGNPEVRRSKQRLPVIQPSP